MENDNHEILFNEVLNFNKRSIALILIALGLIGLFIYAYISQLHTGLILTGMNIPTYWGVYIITFVYFIGIGHAGTLISALLRIMNAELFRPITRLAEATTAFVLMMGGTMIIMDIGRPVRALLYLPLFGRFQSPLLWDFVSISTYFLMSIMFLYLAAIPDLAHLRDRVTNPRWKKLYEILALNFRGTQTQWKQHNRLMLILSALVIPVVISVHTVVSFIFSMTPQPLWHESVFGPFFVLGAIYSGFAFVVITMYLLRKLYGLERYLHKDLFSGMGKIILTLSLIWMYFIIAESITTFYGFEPEHMAVFNARVFGTYQPYWILMVCLNFVIPFLVLVWKRNILTTTLVSVGVLVGMWLERFLILIPTFANPMMPLTEPRYLDPITYIPTWVEIAIVLGAFAVIFLFYFVFTKFIPIIPVSDVREEDEKGAEGIPETNPKYKYKSTKWQSPGVATIQKGLLGTFIVADLGIIMILLNGIRNGFIFGPAITAIRDLSLWFSFAINLYFLPIHIIVLYSITKFMWNQIK